MKQHAFTHTSLLLLNLLVFIGLSCTSPSNNQSQKAPPAEGKAVPTTTQDADFILHYTSPNHKIIINESTLTHLQKIEHFDAKSVSSTPNSVTTKTLADKIPLSSALIAQLQETMNNGFMELNPDYGAPSDQRHYPHFFNVRYNGVNKEILYRSNPNFDPAPTAFKEVETALFNLSEAARR